MNTITFEKAITFTQSLLEKIQTQQISEQETEREITALVQTENGARGFFVTYLTTEMTLADNPSNSIVNALASSPEIVGELLVKNLAMSTAMAVTHSRNNDPAMVQSSNQVSGRSKNLIQRLKSDTIQRKLKQLKESVNTETGEYQSFLERWGYDGEQRQAICAKITPLIVGTN
jgi:hypothetical protein